MPQCPLHLGEDLEPKRKGWFCEECGAIVLGYDSEPRPEGIEVTVAIADPSRDVPVRPKSHSLPCPAAEGTPTHPIAKAKPDLLPRDDTTRWALTAAATRSAKETLRSLAPTSAYLERGGIDDVLPLCFSRPRRGLLIVGPPGVGKTTLLARVVDRLVGGKDAAPKEDTNADETEDPRDVVVFLSGRSDYDVDTAKNRAGRLFDAVARCVDVRPGEFESLEDFVAHLNETAGRDPKPQRKVWLIFDGIDEASSYPELIEALDAFLPCLESYPWVRLVVSLRKSVADALAARGAENSHAPSGAFVSERWLTWFHDDASQRDVPYLELRPFEAGDEARSAYEARRQSELASCNVAYDDLPAATRDLLRAPLLLHLFHETFRGGQTPPSSMDEPGLIDAYLDVLVEDVPGLEKTLSRLGKALLRRHRPDVPLDLGEQWRSEWSTRRIDLKGSGGAKTDPIDELVTASKLMQPDEVGHGPERGPVGWRFTHGRLGEQILLRELFASIAPRTIPTADEILAWSKTAAGTSREGPFTSLTGALEVLVTRLVARGESAFAKRILDIEDQVTRLRLLSAVLRAVGAAWRDDDDVPASAKILDVLVHGAMLRERGPLLISGSWGPLFDLVGQPSRPAIRAYHRKLYEVARGTHGARGNPESRLAYATTLRALGEIADRNGDDSDARRYFEEAIRQLADASTRSGAGDAIRSTLAGAHRQLAAAETDRNRARKGLEAALRVASTTDDESQPLPSGQHHELLLSLLAMGDRLRDAAPREAEAVYEEALRASLAALVESPHRSDLRRCRATALAGLATVAAASDRYDVAAEKFDGSIRVLRKLTRREPHRWDFQLVLVETLSLHASLLRLMSSDHDACQLYEEAAAIMLALVHAHPQRKRWRSDLVRTLANLGVLMRQIGEDEPARACLEDAVRHGRAIEDDVAARRATASALVTLVQLDEAEGRRFEARKHVDEAIGLLRVMARDRAAKSERRCLALALVSLGQLSADDGQAETAESRLREAVRVLSELVTEAPDDMALQADLGEAINGLRYLGGSGRVRRIPKHKFSIMVSERGGAEIREYFDRDKVSIGRAPGNDLMLPNYSVSRHHAKVSFHEGTFTIEDLDSKHGSMVNGKRVKEPVAFRAGDHVELGDFVLVFEGPVDTSYGAQWSSMMANAPTGYPPPVEETKPRVRSELLEGTTLDDEDELQLDSHDMVDIEET